VYEKRRTHCTNGCTELCCCYDKLLHVWCQGLECAYMLKSCEDILNIISHIQLTNTCRSCIITAEIVPVSRPNNMPPNIVTRTRINKFFSILSIEYCHLIIHNRTLMLLSCITCRFTRVFRCIKTYIARSFTPDVYYFCVRSD
jgi:hypothetical protein